MNLSGSGSNDVWATLGAQTLHWDGKAWATPGPSSVPPDAVVLGGWETSATDAWAYGVADEVKFGTGTSLRLHWDGTTWSSSPLAAPITAMWGSSPKRRLSGDERLRPWTRAATWR